MHSNTKGTITELNITVKLLELGYSVFKPITDGNQIDLIAVDINGKTLKLQVKSSTKTKVGFKTDVRRCLDVNRGKKTIYDKNFIDYFAFYFENNVYLIPYDITENKQQFTVRLNKESLCPSCMDGNIYLLK